MKLGRKGEKTFRKVGQKQIKRSDKREKLTYLHAVNSFIIVSANSLTVELQRLKLRYTS